MHRAWPLALAAGAFAAAVLLLARNQPARAADHLDGPAVMTDATTDINDVYAWMEGGKLVMAMTVNPAATAQSKFSNAALYTFHVNSAPQFGMPATEATIVCRFDNAATQNIECWPGSAQAEYVQGDASKPAGLASASGKFKVFAGRREDPFFFNLAGFNAVRTTVRDVAGTLTFDPAGCPTLEAATSAALVSQLKTAPGGGAAVDFFANLDTLAIVVEVDPALVNSGGPVLGVWASTNLAQ
jgi:hypothetical protein